jgi:hypothetical protein
LALDTALDTALDAALDSPLDSGTVCGAGWGGVVVCYAACLGSLLSIWIFFAIMSDWESAAVLGLSAVGIFDVAAIAAAIYVLSKGSRLQRLVAYPGVYMSFYFGLTHVVACWL